MTAKSRGSQWYTSFLSKEVPVRTYPKKPPKKPSKAYFWPFNHIYCWICLLKSIRQVYLSALHTSMKKKLNFSHFWSAGNHKKGMFTMTKF